MIIYKYLDQEGALKTLENNSVRIREPIDFNDPFDCLFFVNKEEKKKAYDLFLDFELFKSFYRDLVLNTGVVGSNSRNLKHKVELIAKKIKETSIYETQPSLSFCRAYAEKKLNKSNRKLKSEFEQTITSVLKKLRTVVLVGCFGLSSDSVLMWSHYAQKHKGACLEFEIDDKDFKKVSYSDTIPNFQITRLLGIIFGHQFLEKEIDMEKDEYQFALEPLLTKSADWKYENEVRCAYSKNKKNDRIKKIENEKGEIIFLLDMPSVKRVFIGCKADKDFVQALKDKAGDIPFVKMKMSKDKYEVSTQ